MSSHDFDAHHSDSDFEPTPPRQRRPRLPSPRLFRDFFDDMPSDSHQSQPTFPPANYADSVRDVERSIRNANRAIHDAQRALQRGQIRNDSRSDVVDLTGSPPDRSSGSRFISNTVHPHDTPRHQQRISNPMNQPVYGVQSSSLANGRESSPEVDPSDSGLRARMRRAANYRRFIPLPQPPNLPAPLGRNVRMEEEQAVRRQREARSLWERTQLRTSQIQNTPQQSPPRPQPQDQDVHSPIASSPEPEPESVDLTTVEDNKTLAAALSRQRQEAIASQNSSSAVESGRTPLSAYKCPICMETPQDATTTVCGHLFCHKCIINTLKWSENQRREEMPAGRRPKGTCPVCRKELSRSDGAKQGRHIIPLEIKFLTRKRKRDKGKGVERKESEGDDAAIDGSGKENKHKKLRKEETEEDLWGEFTNDVL